MMRELTMEETFILTYLLAIIGGVGLGVLTYFVFKHDNNQEGKT